METVFSVRGSLRTGDGWIHCRGLCEDLGCGREGRMEFTEELPSCVSLGSEGGQSLCLWTSHLTFLCKGIIIPDNQNHFIGFQVL